VTKGPCPLESRPRGVGFYDVVRSTGTLGSPLDFVSGCGLVSAPFRAGPTRSLYRRALGCTLERGNETAHRPTAATRELVARSPHTAFPVERSRLCRLSLASGVSKGGKPLVDSFPYFLANQEIGPSETSRKGPDKLEFIDVSKYLSYTVFHYVFRKLFSFLLPYTRSGFLFPNLFSEDQ